MFKNILNFLKKPKISTPLFVISSLTTLILLGLFFFALQVNWRYQMLYNASQNQLQLKQLNHTDPLITPTPNFNNQLASPIINNQDPAIGPDNAKIIIVEFSDFECQFCHEQEKTIQGILNEYPNEVKLIWKDYPSYNTNSPSFRASVAARCADQQGKFWEYHDWLFEDKTIVKNQTFSELADKLKLNKNDFKKCFDKQITADLIKDNIYEANALDIQGIPFIFINQNEIMGEISFQELKQLIDKELTK